MKGAQRPDPTGEVFVGTVKSSSAKFGFIECAEIQETYGDNCDCFCLGSQLVDFKIGDTVRFTVGINKDGKPQALEVASAEEGVPAGPEPTGETYVGTVKSASAKFGFIECAELREQYDCDCYCLGGQLNGFRIGDQVNFTVGLSKDGKPQAIEVAPAGKREDGRDGKRPTPTGEKFIGNIKSLSSKFGFIESKQIKERYGEVDCFVLARQLTGLSVGDRVQFEVGLNDEGKPQALTLTKQMSTVWGGSQGKGGSSASKGPSKGPGGNVAPRAAPMPAAAFQQGPGALGMPWGMGAMGGAMGAVGAMMGGGAPKGGGQIIWVPQWVSNSDLAQGQAGRSLVGGGKAGGRGDTVRLADLGKGGSTGHKGGNGAAGAIGGIKRKPESSGETFTGKVKSSSAKFGFIESAEVTNRYGSDCFCLGEQLVGYTVGDAVRFEVGLNAKGQPQALSIQPARAHKAPKAFQR